MADVYDSKKLLGKTVEAVKDLKSEEIDYNRNVLPIQYDLTKWNKESTVSLTWDDTEKMYRLSHTQTAATRYGIYYDAPVLPNTTYVFSIIGKKGPNKCDISIGDTAAWPGADRLFTSVKTKQSVVHTTGSNVTVIRIYIAISCTSGNAADNYMYINLPKLVMGFDGNNPIQSLIDMGPSTAEVREQDTSLTTSSPIDQWIKALLKTICIKFPNLTNHRFSGTVSPSSNAYYEVFIYSTGSVNSTTGLPQYCFGTFTQLNYEEYIFYTNQYTFNYGRKYNYFRESPYLKNAFEDPGSSSGRPTTADFHYHDNKLRYFLATSSMTTGYPGTDSQILYLPWDNTGYDVELAFTHTPGIEIRYEAGSTWGDWKKITMGETIDQNSVAALNYSSYKDRIPCINYLAYWNGAYSGRSSNLKYCTNGVMLGGSQIIREGKNFNCTAQSLAAQGGSQQITCTMGKSGWFPIGLAGVNTSLPSGVVISKYYMYSYSTGSVTIYVTVTNIKTSAVSLTTSHIVAPYVIWAKVS